MASEKIPDGLIEVQSQYTVEDIYDAHEALDIIEALTAEADAKARQEAKKKR